MFRTIVTENIVRTENKAINFVTFNMQWNLALLTSSYVCPHVCL